jgi:hypothetical protein
MQRFSIGRTPNCDIFLNDPSVSKMHAEIVVNNGEATVRDLGSTNGTFINGMRLYGTQPLKQFDILKVGNSLVPWKNYVGPDGTLSGGQIEQFIFSGETKTPSVKEWILIHFLTAIPLIGLIMLIIWANQPDKVKKNFAQGRLWWLLIYLGVLIFFYLIVVLFIFRLPLMFWYYRFHY